MSDDVIDTRAPIHEAFGLTYAAYLVVPRTVLQSMPAAWQAKLVVLIDEMNAAIPYERERDGEYHVSYRDSKGRIVRDELRDYKRGRRRLPLTER